MVGDDPAHRPFLPALLLDFPAIIFASSVTDQHHVTAGRQEQLRWLCYFSLSCDQCFASAALRHRPPTTTKPPRPPILGGPTQRDFCYRRNKDQSTLSSHFSTHRINPARGKRTGEGLGLGVGEGGGDAALHTNLLLFGQRQDAVCAREFDVGVTVHPLPDLWVEQPLGAADAGWEPRPRRAFIHFRKHIH